MSVNKAWRGLLYGLVLLLSQSCMKPQLKPFNEIVMCKGMRIVAKRHGETLEISALTDVRRSYAIDGLNASFDLWPWDERWYGSLGLVSPNGNRQMHAVLEEGHQYFISEQEALEWLKWRDDRFHYVYNSSGLVVGWNLQRNPNSFGPPYALSVQVWQFYINGKKPTSLADANDDALQISYPDDRCEHTAKPSGFKASSPQWLAGRFYAGRAIDTLKERDIDPQQVEQAIRKGEHYKHNGFDAYFYYDPHADHGHKMLTVFLDESGRVVLLVL